MTGRPSRQDASLLRCHAEVRAFVVVEVAVAVVEVCVPVGAGSLRLSWVALVLLPTERKNVTIKHLTYLRNGFYVSGKVLSINPHVSEHI
jgi:hypothetical protein